mmetsp:Transcript_34848/g.71166  ORF Transcript_34848/g.71166 Transcript_34848/m.71166 type:complete len:206 (+) Transcript_34848:36-653(+)
MVYLTNFLLQPVYDLMQMLFIVALIIPVVIPAVVLGMMRGHLKRFTTFGLYKCFEGWPLGNWIFTRAVTLFAPYSGSIYATIENLQPGSCTVLMHDRPWLRNPFNSLHAIALANFAEMATGIVGITTAEAENGKVVGIPVSSSIKYHAKARGTMRCRCDLPNQLPKEPGIYPMDLTCDVIDSKGLVVASAIFTWSFKVKESKKKQ